MKGAALLLLALLLAATGTSVVAQVGLPWPGPGTPHSAGGGAQTAWNPNDKVTFTLSTTSVTNDTTTAVSNGNYQDVRSCFQSTSCTSTPSNAYTSSYGGTGKVFAQFIVAGAAVSNNTYTGFCTAAVSPFLGGSSAPCGNNDNNGVVMSAGTFGSVSPSIRFNNGGSTLSLGGSSSTAMTFELAFDIGGAASSCGGTPCVWGRYKNGAGAFGDWNNQVGETPGGSHPFVLTGGPTGSFWVYGGESFNESGATIQLNCAATPPSGYTAC